MKNVRFVLIILLSQIVLTGGAKAANSDPDFNPNTQVDADGVPLSDTRPQGRPLTQDEINSLRKQQQKAAMDKDWLVRNYEQQLQTHSTGTSSSDPNANLYFQLSTNKQLAKLAGIPVLDDSAMTPTPRTNRPATLRADASSPATGATSAHFFKPLITPLGAPEAAGLHDIYSSPLSDATTSPFAMGAKAKPAAAPTVDTSDPADIETPGMIAAEKDPLAQSDVANLDLDILPGETIEQAKAHQENRTKLELTLPMDADQLHRAQAAKLAAPTASNATPQAQVTTPVKKAPIEDQNAPIPVSKNPQISPVRNPIANPYDILDR